MERRDYIQRHIEELGQVLAKLWAQLLNLPKEDEETTVVSTVSSQLREQVDSELLDALAPDRLHEALAKGEIDHTHVDALIDMLIKQAELLDAESDAALQQEIFSIALSLCEYRTKTDLAYSLDNYFLLQKLRLAIAPRTVVREDER